MRASSLALAIIVISASHAVMAQDTKTVRIFISERDACLVDDVEVACRDVGTKLHQMAIPSGARITIRAGPKVKYQIVSITLESIRNAGLGLKIGVIPFGGT